MPPCAVKLVFSEQDEGREIVCNPVTQEYFKVGPVEAAFIKSLDGSRSIAEIEAHFAGTLTASMVKDLLDWLAANQLLAGAEVEAGSSATGARRLWRKVTDWLRGKSKIRILFPNPEPMLQKLASPIWFGQPAIVLCWILSLAPLLAVVASPEIYGRLAALPNTSLHLAGWASVVVLLLASAVIHEFAHGVTCVYFGGRVRKMGLMFMYFFPALFCDVSASWAFPERRHKVLVASAGLIASLVIGGLYFLLWVGTDWTPLLYAALLSLPLVLLNLLPLVKLDGYWILVHMVNEPNLRSKSFQRLFQVLRGPGRLASASTDFTFYFGLASVAGTCFFSIFGLISIHRYTAYFWPDAANPVAIAFASMMGFRLHQFLNQYLRGEPQ